MTNVPHTTTHRGFEVTFDAQAQRRGMVCAWYIPALRRACRNPQHAAELIDAHLAAQAERPAGQPTIVAADVRVVHGLSCGQRRRRIEQARGQARRGGKFAKERAA